MIVGMMFSMMFFLTICWIRWDNRNQVEQDQPTYLYK